MKPIYILGDIHGNFNHLMWKIRNDKMKDCIIFQVGDFGIGFTTEFNDMNTLGLLNRFLIEKNIEMYVIRGNHDNPKFFDGHLINHFENLHLLPDYTVIELAGKKILAVGGAVSIDRKQRLGEMQMYRRKGHETELYWFDELFVLDEEKLKDVEGIDVVITHTAPNFCHPTNKLGFGYLVEQFAQDDDKLLEDLVKERNDVTRMWELLKEKNPNIKYHFYGHFHANHSAIINGVEHKLVGINEFHDPRFNFIDEMNEKYDE